MIVVEAFLRGRLLARYAGDDALASLPHAEREQAMVALAQTNLLKDRLVDAPHLGDLRFEVRTA